MNKALWSSEQIREELQRQINKIREITEDETTVVVPLPQENELDGTGCNWSINSIRNGNEYMGDIQRIIQNLQSCVNLKSE